MPTSPYSDTVVVLDFLGKLLYGQQASVLDVGAGFGRWGYLLRCHLGCGIDLQVRPQKKLHIEAIEAFEPNITPLYESIYDNTHHGDAAAILPSLPEYDVIIASHVLEHLEKPAGERLLEQMLEHSRVATIICLPFREWPQGEVLGNPYERHRAAWRPSDFKRFGAHIKRFNGDGVVIIPRSDEARWLVRMMNSPLRHHAFRACRRLGCFRRKPTDTP